MPASLRRAYVTPKKPSDVNTNATATMPTSGNDRAHCHEQYWK